MKKIFMVFLVIAGMVSCENWDNEFPDHDYTTGYFPYQYPVRTLILGNYIYDNSNDNNHKFVISVGMGGVYENKQDRIFSFAVDESLCNQAYFENGDTIRALPSRYYQLSSPDKIVIPSEKVNGGVEIQLTEDFFNDPEAIKNTYVVPLRLTGIVGLDSLLQGLTTQAYADRRIPSQWTIEPKDFTMFAVKFVNPFHGSYLHSGRSETNLFGVQTSTVYSAEWVEDNEIWDLTTISRTGVSVSGLFKSTEEDLEGLFHMNLIFASDDYNAPGGVTCTIEEAEGSPYRISGIGKYSVNTESFGNKDRDAIYLDYTITGGDTLVYKATDMLIFRNKGISMETYSIQIIPDD